MNKTYLHIDANNFLYKTFFKHIKETLDISISVCHHVTLMSINKYFKKYNVDEVVIAFDAFSWRKTYTSDPSVCITHQKYKGHRRADMSPTDKEKMEKFDEHIPQFKELFQTLTNCIVLHEKYLEADDLIAGFIQMHPDDDHILLSADKDFMQLLGRNNLRLINPVDDKERTLSEFDDDPYYFIFQKCFRGDRGDNVMSAYPRLRETKIKAAYTDPLLRTNIMQNEFSVMVNKDSGMPEERTYLTEDVFYENELLMDLTKQPDTIRDLIDSSIKASIENRGKFNYIEFLRYCSKYDLENIRKMVDDFIPMLTCGKKKGA